MAVHDLQALAPASVTVAFPRVDSGVPSASGAVYAVTVTLASLRLAEYGRGVVTGHSGSHAFHDSAAATFAGGGTPTNAAELTALATQAAQDFYLWRLGRLDVAYAGLVPYVPEGLSDHVEWVCREGAGQVHTRVVPRPRNDLADTLNHWSATGKAADFCCPGVTAYDGNTYVNNFVGGGTSSFTDLTVTNNFTLTSTSTTTINSTTVDVSSLTVWNFNSTEVNYFTAEVTYEDTVINVTENTVYNYEDTTVINYNDGATVNFFDVDVTYENTTVNVTDSTVFSFDSTTVLNEYGDVNYYSTAVSNYYDSEANYFGTTVVNYGGTVVNNYGSTTVINVGGTVNHTSTSVTNYNAGSTQNYTSTTINVGGATVITVGGTTSTTYGGSTTITYNGTVIFAGGTCTFGSTSAGNTAPASRLYIPVLTVAAKPTFSSSQGEVICGGKYFYQYDGTAWREYAYNPATTKGDLTVYNGTDPVRLAPGTNGQILYADSTTASGLKWAGGSASGLVPSGPAPQPPTSLTAGTATATTQPLSWTAPAGGAAAKYAVYYSTAASSGAWTFAATTTSTSYTVTGLTASTAYWYCVTSLSAGNAEGPYCAPVTATTPAIASVTGCTTCNPSPQQWTFTTAGITNGTSPDCAAANGTFVLDYVSGCVWRDSGVGVTGGDTWTLQFDGVGHWNLSLDPSGPTWAIASGLWDCMGPNTLSLSSSTGICANWPATITLNPV